MKISMIAAMAQNRVIGAGNRLLWHIPEDFRHFKTLTIGKPVIMGRKTFDSIGRPLPKRPNIVITRNTEWQSEGVSTAANLESALKEAEKLGTEEAMVIGGAQIYEQALPFATSVYLTIIHKIYDGDALFPVLDANHWQETSRAKGNECQSAGVEYEFITYTRVRS